MKLKETIVLIDIILNFQVALVTLTMVGLVLTMKLLLSE